MSRLQSVQNAVARLVSGARRHDRITPVLQQLHWLPVLRRVDFKMTCTLVIPVPVRHGSMQLTWPPTVSWSPTKVVVSCALPTQGRVVRRTYSTYGDRCCTSRTVEQSSSTSETK